ncbi:MAG: helix-turn-helix transcriptional regulator [Kiritimatiellia bacterium]|jgi:transcriptional regulator with XRE-family HTH domain|nr:helix-turn-helix transcriptional regulator [Kiritimatiellia bacterium]MDP6811187.1 helix-turn-helix transcriptional regulator [Kiritimatiellia bacterium]MDP7025255.1 helix-turn-helix transcriptional regulator [Kiritimatiellia bacterium]
MSNEFGQYLRKRREELLKGSPDFTVRKVAGRLGIQPSYVSKVERCEVPPPSEATILRWAEELGEDPDVLLALAGKVSAELRDVIVKRPKVFAQLLRELKDAPDHALLRVVREVRDGKW